MPICRRSATEVRALGSAVAAACILATPALGAQPAAATGVAAIQDQGNAAAERLKAALAKQKAAATPIPTPTLPPLPAPQIQRRAFDGVHRSPNQAMDGRARAALASGRAELARGRDAMAKRLGQALGLEAPDVQALAKGATPASAKGWVPALFASSSMPVATLRTYAAQLEKVHGVMAFRGMPGGLTKVAPMAKLSAEILRRDPGCEGPACVMRDVQLIVDPILFRQHGVMRVPALAMVPGDPTQPYCEREDDSPTAAHIIYGDSALSGMLAEYARLGGGNEVSDAQVRLDPR